MAGALLFTARGVASSPAEPELIVPTPAGTSESTSPWPRVVAFVLRAGVNLTMLVLIAAFTLVALLPATGARAMIVLSGSMDPLVAAGDAAIIRDVPVENLRVGDVVTFFPIGADKRLTTHRIIGRVELASGLHFQTQGDANTTPDVDLAPARNVLGRYEGRVPHGGRALLLLSRPEARIGLIAVPALFFLVGELRGLAATLRQRRSDAGPGRAHGLALGVAVLALAAGGGIAATMATMAVLTDVAIVSDNTLSTASSF